MLICSIFYYQQDHKRQYRFPHQISQLFDFQNQNLKFESSSKISLSITPLVFSNVSYNQT